MNPSIDDRLASILRAMTDIVLPALPADSSLAREQLQLCIGHLSILRDHVDRAEAFEQEALADVRHLAADLAREAEAGGVVADDLAALRQLIAPQPGGRRAERERINQGICALLQSPTMRTHALSPRLKSLVIGHEQVRAAKNRQWFAAMGFDREFTA
jgi:hypothetical protein